MSRGKQEITIKSIARKAGVSISTVSYVISKKRKISKDVSDHVLSIMKDMGYKPNVVARNLASKKTWCIGLYTPPVKSIRYDLYFNSVLSGIMDSLHKEGYQLLLYGDYLNEEAGEHQDLTMSQPIDGALVMNPRENCVYRNYLEEIDLPHVIMGLPPGNSGVDGHYIAHDHEAAVALSINHLLRKGYRKPVLITHRQEYDVFSKLTASFRKALTDAGERVSGNRIFSGEVSRETGYEVAERVFREPDPPDSFIVMNDVVSLGVLQYLEEHGISVPKQAGLISVGGTLTGELYKPALTTIAYSPYELGFKASSYLLEVVRKERIRAGVEMLPVRLEERETT